MTRLRQQMLGGLQRRNYPQGTIATYLRTIQDLTLYFGKPRDRLGPEQIRRYQVHLRRERKLAVTTVRLAVAAPRFFIGKILRRGYTPEHLRYPKHRQRLPAILSQEEVTRLIEAASAARNRHCPKCQVQARQRWLAVREQELYTTRYPCRLHAPQVPPSPQRVQPRRPPRSALHQARRPDRLLQRAAHLTFWQSYRRRPEVGGRS